MTRLRFVLIAALAASLAGFDAWTASSRCPLSPGIDLNFLFLGLTLQALSPAVFYLGYRLAGDDIEPKMHQWIWFVGLILAVLGAAGLRQSVLYSDTIGQRNWSGSAGMQCGR